MKKLLAVLMVLCMLLSLAACGAEKPAETDPPKVDEPVVQEDPKVEEPKDPDPVTIRFWQAGGDTVGAASIMRLLLDKFEAQYPWITVDYQAIPWSNDPETQFQTGIASGDVADVLSLGDSKSFILAGEGGLLPLDDMLTEETKNDLSDLLKSAGVYYGSENPDAVGKMMYVAWYGGTRAILYNKAIFDHFGVEYPTERMTHAELLEMAKKLTGEMDGKQVYGFGTRATDSAQYIHFMWNYGASLIDQSTMRAGTDTEEWKKGTEDYLKFYTEGVTPEGSSAMDATTQLQMFVNGEIAMFVSAIDYAQAIRVEEGWEEKLGVAALVGETYATTYTGADVLAVPSTTQHPEEAALLLNFLLGPEAQAVYCKNVGFFPASKTASADPFFSDDPIQAGFAATMDGVHFYGNFGVSTGAILRAHMQMLLNGDYASIEEYQEALTAEINMACEEKFG